VKDTLLLIFSFCNPQIKEKVYKFTSLSLSLRSKKKRETTKAMKPLPTSINEKETHWPKPRVSSTREKEELTRIWRATSRPLLQTKTLRATGFFKSAPSCCQFVCLEHRMSVLLEGFLCIKAIDMIQSV